MKSGNLGPAVDRVEAEVNEHLDPDIHFEGLPGNTVYDVFVDIRHPAVNRQYRIGINVAFSEEHMVDKLYRLVNCWPYLRDLCDHQVELVYYRGRFKVCPVCWRERQ